MEKEEKIAERERIADERSFFGRLREYYPAFALFYVSVLRLLVFYLTEIKMRASMFIFPTQCLDIFNLPITVLATFASQTLITNFTEKAGASMWPIDQDIIFFHVIFCIGLGVISFALKTALKKKESDKDPVFQSLVCSSLLYTVLFFTIPPAVF